MADIVNDPTLVYFDRLKTLIRFQQNGEKITRGGADDGTIKLCIHKGDRGLFVRATSGQLEVLLANIQETHNPRPLCSVSESGESITLCLIDSANGRRPYRRKFTMVFLDESTARTFFRIFHDALRISHQGLGFNKLKEKSVSKSNQVKQAAAKQATACSDSDNDVLSPTRMVTSSPFLHSCIVDEMSAVDIGITSDDGSADHVEQDGIDDSGPIIDNNTVNHEEVEEDDLNIIDLDEDFGESQDLYYPLRPFGDNKY